MKRGELNSRKWFLLVARPPFYSKVLANFIVRAPSSFSEFLRSLESFRGNIDGVLTGPSIVSPIPTCIAICYLINIDYCDRLNWVSKPTAHDVSKWSPVRILTVYGSMVSWRGKRLSYIRRRGKLFTNNVIYVSFRFEVVEYQNFVIFSRIFFLRKIRYEYTCWTNLDEK